MSVHQFPKIYKRRKGPQQEASAASAPDQPATAQTAAGRAVSNVLDAAWFIVVLSWPFLRWVLSLDCVFQFLRMLALWDTPGTYAGFTFLLHFIVFVALTYFVAFFNPKSLAPKKK